MIHSIITILILLNKDPKKTILYLNDKSLSYKLPSQEFGRAS
jgi:hypothetical protein